MANPLKALIETASTWSAEDQAELVEYAREIEARRTGRYVMTDEERAAVAEGLAQVRRGELVPDDEMDRLWKRFGL